LAMARIGHRPLALARIGHRPLGRKGNH